MKPLIIAAAVILAVAAVLLIARERTWATIIGPADLGPVDFATLSRPATPNSWLVCPPGHCRNYPTDAQPPVFNVPEAALQSAVQANWQQMPRTRIVASTTAGSGEIRFVQYSALLGFPDTISVQTIAIDETHSTLAAYSRSQVGKSDLGANRLRMEKWLAALKPAT